MERPAHYDEIGQKYNETRCADPYLTTRFRQFLNPQTGENYLDVGCGTGNYTCALASGEYQFYGMDVSEVMLAEARPRDCNVIWQKGAAENLPFADKFFGGAMCSLTIHHWKDLEKAFAEIGRVLKPNGRFVLFTAFPEQMKHYWLKHYFPQMLRDSIKQMPAFSKIKEVLKTAGFEIIKRENYFIRDDLEDHFLYSGKNRPELYLREDIQRGISSFSALAHRGEVETGLKRLAADIRENRISRIIENYESTAGDYVFIVAEIKS